MNPLRSYISRIGMVSEKYKKPIRIEKYYGPDDYEFFSRTLHLEPSDNLVITYHKDYKDPNETRKPNTHVPVGQQKILTIHGRATSDSEEERVTDELVDRGLNVNDKAQRTIRLAVVRWKDIRTKLSRGWFFRIDWDIFDEGYWNGKIDQ